MSFEKRQNHHNHRPGSKPWKEANSPPKEASWMWIDLTILQAPAWQVLPWQAKLIVFRLIQEHHEHAGFENGVLKLTWDQIEALGISRRNISWAIDCVCKLGFVKVTRQGSGRGKYSKCATYALTFRPTALNEGANLPTNEWKGFKTVHEATAALPIRKPRNYSEKISQCPGDTGASVRVTL